MRGIKIPQQVFALKMPGGLMREGGAAYLRDTTVYNASLNTISSYKTHV